MVKFMMRIMCDKCLVNKSCQYKGSSPTTYKKKTFSCEIIGGYGREEVPDEKLSEENKENKKKFGKSLTIFHTPLIEDEILTTVVNVVFHEPIVHAREKTNYMLDMIYPKSH